VAIPVFAPPIGLSWPVPRSVIWDTVKHDAISGKRIRFPNWTYPTYKYEMPINLLRLAAAYQEWQTLEGFINAVQGAAQLWAYNDPNDNAVSNQVFGVGDGNTVAFQLVRGFGGFAAPVFLINGTPAITVAGTLTSSFTVSAYGVVTFAAAPAAAAALAWTGSFYFPCRFDDDTSVFENFMSGLARIKSLKFSTEKLP
jgi:hypothetical protein